MRLSADEITLIDLGNKEVEGLLEQAQNGEGEARDRLCSWSYLTASRYYREKVRVEKTLKTEDAEDLTTAFFLEFDGTLPRLRSATHFTRHVLKQNLKRYLKRKKQRLLKETPTPLNELENKAEKSAAAESTNPWERWTDEKFLQYQTVLQSLNSADDLTRQAIEYRLEHPPMPYQEIAGHLNMPETAIRMRVARFYSLVRKKYQKIMLH